MSEHTARITWKGSGTDFAKGRYSREHHWEFDGGLTVPASPSPSVVRPPYSNPANIDPEEAYVAAIASCHMLTFLHLASRAGFLIEAYEDQAVGKMTKNGNGVLWVSNILLDPRITFGGESQPSPGELRDLHHQAHEQCFIANSVNTVIEISGL